MKRILIDAHMIGEKETGNETYIINLIKGLTKIDTNDTLFYISCTNVDYLRDIIGNNDKFVPIRVSKNSFMRLFVDFQTIEKKYDIDLFFFTYHPAYFIKLPVITVIHDISFKVNPKWFSLRDRIVLNTGVGRAVDISKKIVTLSKFSKNEIIKYYSVDEEKVEYIYLAPPVDFSNNIDCNDGIINPLMKKSFILVVGGNNPRKNLERIIESYNIIKDKIKEILIVTGNVDVYYVDKVRELGIKDRVVFTGYVENDVLRCLYRNAKMLLYPSLYEGFGLPIVEAMVMGTPVITSNIGSMAEISHNAALLVNPYNKESIADGILKLINDNTKREELIRKGYERVSKLSWEKAARETYKVFNEVLNNL